jgi:hypothetical protein
MLRGLLRVHIVLPTIEELEKANEQADKEYCEAIGYDQ